MYGMIMGITDTDQISYFPKCGERVYIFGGDGTAKCEECGLHFGVVECNEDDEE